MDAIPTTARTPMTAIITRFLFTIPSFRVLETQEHRPAHVYESASWMVFSSAYSRFTDPLTLNLDDLLPHSDTIDACVTALLCIVALDHDPLTLNCLGHIHDQER
jgi:hypothetical protein